MYVRMIYAKVVYASDAWLHACVCTHPMHGCMHACALSSLMRGLLLCIYMLHMYSIYLPREAVERRAVAFGVGGEASLVNNICGGHECRHRVSCIHTYIHVYTHICIYRHVECRHRVR